MIPQGVSQLDLTPPPTPPPVPLRRATATAAALRASADRLAVALRVAEGDRRLALAASRSVRLAAAETLQAALPHGLEAIAGTGPIAARQVAELAPATDALLRVSAGPHAGPDARVSLLIQRLGDDDRSLFRRRADLLELAMLLDGRAALAPWPVTDPDGRPQPATPHPPPQAAAALVAAADEAVRRLRRPDATGDASAAPARDDDVLDDADAARVTLAASDPAADDDAGRAIRRRGALVTLAATLERLQPLRWVDRNDRGRLAALARRALRDLAARDLSSAVDAIDDLAATAEVLLALDHLRTVDIDRFRAASGIARTLRRIDDPARPRGEDAVASRQGKRTLAQCVRRMAATSRDESRPAPAVAVEARRELRRERRRVEETLLGTLDELADRDDAATDPRLAAMLAAQRQVQADLLRLDAIFEWAPRLALLDAPREAAIRRQLEKLVRWLRDPNRRPDADRVARQLERQLAGFAPLPGERLLAQDALPSLATGAMSRRILEAIDAVRQRWSAEWAVGNGGGPATALLWRWHRLLRSAVAIETTRPGTLHDEWCRGPGVALLGPPPWPDWLVPLEALRQHAGAAIEPLGVALRSIDRDGQRDALRTLEREAALPRLAVALARALEVNGVEPEDAAAPGGRAIRGFRGAEGAGGADPATALDGRLLDPPRDAVMASHRGALLQLGIAVCEHGAAIDDGAPADAGRLHAFALHMADDLVDRIDPPQRTTPTLPGFDGSDPDARR